MRSVLVFCSRQSVAGATASAGCVGGALLWGPALTRLFTVGPSMASRGRSRARRASVRRETASGGPSRIEKTDKHVGRALIELDTTGGVRRWTVVYGLNPRRLSVYFTVRFKALDSRRKHLACESLHTFPGRPKVHYVVIFGNVDEERRTALGWHFRYCSWILYRRRVVVASG